MNAESRQQTPTLTIEQAFQQAIAHHQAGQLHEAECLYRAILQAQPNHADTNYNLGVLAVQVKQPVVSLTHFKIALEADPDQGQYWLSYIDALIQTGQNDAARQVLEQGRRRGLQGEAVEAVAAKLEEIFESEPSLQEIDAGVALFNEGRYKEALIFAQTLTARFPQHGFGWKILGAVLQQMGQNAAALAPMQKAATLMPGDAMAHSNLGNALRNLGYLNDAVVSCRRALEIQPDCAEAHNNLGNVQQDLGQFDEAVLSYRRALEIKPDYAEAHNNLGNVQQDLGQFDEAVLSYRRALNVKPNFAEAHSNLGNALRCLGKIDDAVSSFRRALEIKPDYADAHSNLGNTLRHLGQLDEALKSCQRALEIKPDYAQVYCNLGHILCDLDDLEHAAIAYQKCLDIDSSSLGLDAAVYLAILHYLDGDLKQCRDKLLESQPIMANVGFKQKNVRIYWRYLDKLQYWHLQSKQNANQIQQCGTLYVVGESHSLSAHGVVVRYNEQEMRCSAEWISGCKQWHLGNDKHNKYKHKFEAVLARLPRCSVILLFIGEIDCRHDEGIIKVCKKYPEKTLAEIVQSTVDDYMKYVAAVGARYGHQIIVGGVPASNISLDALSGAETELFSTLIRIFNTTLKKTSLTAGFAFLDVYALTDRGDGYASGELHIDGIHLLPSAVVEAFNRFYLQGITLPSFSAAPLNSKKKFTIKPVKPSKFNRNLAPPQAKHPSQQEIKTLAAMFNGGGYTKAAIIAEEMTVRFPLYGFGWRILGAAYKQLGQSMNALAPMQNAVALMPSDAEAHYNLGVILQDIGRYDDAEASYRRALLIKSDYVGAHYNLGIILQNNGMLGEAEACYLRALDIKPDHAKAHGNLGNVLYAQGKWDEAVACYRHALSFMPDLAEVHSDLGNALQNQGELEEAVYCYRRALSIKPDFAEAYSNLGNAFMSQGKLGEAIDCYKQAIVNKPHFAEAYSHLGSALKAQGQLDEAIVCHKQALLFNPSYVNALSNLGNAFLDQGRLEEANACYRRALLLRPSDVQAYSGLLLAMQYMSTVTAHDVYSEHKCYADCHEAPLKGYWKTHRNSCEFGRRLKVGYVSPDFRRHSVAYFIESVIRNHDKTRFEISCYFNSVQADGVTLRFISMADHWVPCKGMTDAQLVEKIQADGIDILVDLAGHTADNRLLAFARKPAPVQVTYLGYATTTGLTAMDYRLTDIYADPPGTDDELYTEKLVRLPKTFLCFCPPEDGPEVQALPAIHRGFVTFGSFNTLSKITPSVVCLWSRILLAIPDSRLVVKSIGLNEPGTRAHLLAMFEQHGILAKRLTLLAKGGKLSQHLAHHHGVDICLDSFPYNGTTTTCEAMWMGVPTITLCGDRHSTRVGASLLSNLGLEELIAENHDEYLHIAERLASDTTKLANLRSGLRQRLIDSPLLDAVGLTRNIEKAYQEMWSTWTRGNS